MKILQSRAFLLALLLLLVNDFILKYNCPNWMTGKLSDFAGLFIFPIFWVAIFPKYKRQIFWSTAIAFVIWKSPLVDGAISAWNELGFFSLKRVVDYSDYLALSIIPLAYYYFTKVDYKTWKIEPVFILLISCFAFMATSAERQRLLALEYMPMAVFEIQRDSLPEASPMGIWDKPRFQHELKRFNGNSIQFLRNFWSRYRAENAHYPHEFSRYDEGSEIFVHGKYLILRKTGIGYYPSRRDIHNFRDQMDFEKDKQRAFEQFSEDYSTIDARDVLQEEMVLIYDSLSVSPYLEIAPTQIKRIDSLSIELEAFGYRYDLTIKNSLVDGAFAQFYQGGQLKQKGQFSKGIVDGTWEQYDEDNKKLKTDRFEQGRLMASSSGSDADTLISYDEKINRVFWYNALCLIGLLLVAGYVIYRILHAWWYNEVKPYDKGFWNFIADIFISFGSCILLAFIGSITVVMLVSMFKETAVFVSRYVPFSIFIVYLFVAFLFFVSTRKHYYILFFLLGFICLYFICNEIYYLSELNAL